MLAQKFILYAELYEDENDDDGHEFEIIDVTLDTTLQNIWMKIAE